MVYVDSINTEELCACGKFCWLQGACVQAALHLERKSDCMVPIIVKPLEIIIIVDK